MQTYHGGCHCGRVRYEADMELTKAIECNCSHCADKGFILAFVPASQVRITKGNESDLTEYKFNKMHISHLFCPVCGVQPFGRAQGEEGTDTFAINVRTLDEELPSTLEISKFDGKNY